MVKAVLFDCFGVVLDVVTNERMEATIDFIRELKGEYKLGMISRPKTSWQYFAQIFSTP